MKILLVICNHGILSLQMDKQRNTLLEALSRQGLALCAEVHAAAPAEPSQETLEQLDSIAADIMKFVEPTDSKVCCLLPSSAQV